ncbi:MAG: DUF192 domain-containing protein [Candidatus Altiarchaeota archaeon]
MKTILLAVTILVLISMGCSEKKEYNRVCFRDDLCVDAEVADNADERSNGLMRRESLEWDSGMLFVFEGEGYPSFWMKNTLIPLDMLWIGEGGRIEHIEYAVPCERDPCMTYRAYSKSLYVLEVNGNYTLVNGIKVGDYVRIS